MCHRIVAALVRHAKDLTSFWLPILSRHAFTLRRAFEALGAQIYDPLIFAEFKSTVKVGIFSLQKSKAAFTWLRLAFFAVLSALFTTRTSTNLLYLLFAAMFISYPQYIMTTSEHKKVVAHLQQQLEDRESAALDGTGHQAQRSVQETKGQAGAEKVLQVEVDWWKQMAMEQLRSADEAKAERNNLRQILHQKNLQYRTLQSISPLVPETEMEEAKREAELEDEEFNRHLGNVANGIKEGSVDKGEEKVVEVLACAPEEDSKEAETAEVDMTNKSTHVPGEYPPSAEKKEAEALKPMVKITPPKFTKDEAQASNPAPGEFPKHVEEPEMVLEKASDSTPVFPLSTIAPPSPIAAASPIASASPIGSASPVTAKADLAMNLKARKQKFSAAASAFVPTATAKSFVPAATSSSVPAAASSSVNATAPSSVRVTASTFVPATIDSSAPAAASSSASAAALSCAPPAASASVTAAASPSLPGGLPFVAPAPSYVPAYVDKYFPPPPPQPMTIPTSYPNTHGSPFNPQPYPQGRTSHFGRLVRTPPGPSSSFQPPRPLPAPFHINGFRPGTAPGFGNTQTPTRQPNAAGQMFTPRPDRMNNRQRAQQSQQQQPSQQQGQQLQYQQFPDNPHLPRGHHWIPTQPSMTSAFEGGLVTQEPEDEVIV